MTKCIHCGSSASSISCKKLSAEQQAFWDGTSDVCPVCYKNQTRVANGKSKDVIFWLIVVGTFVSICLYWASNYEDIKGSYIFKFAEIIEVDAVIISSSLAHKTDSDSRNIYMAEVAFSYRINGKNHMSNQLDFYSRWSYDYKFEKGLADYYYPNQKVKAFCPANNHQYCVLRPDINYRRGIIIESLFMLLAFGSLAFLSRISYLDSKNT